MAEPGTRSIDEVADALFGAIEAGDVDTVRALYDPDVEVWHNTDETIQRRDQNLASLSWMAANLHDRRYEEVRRQLTDDGFVQQHVLRVTTGSGRRVSMPGCLVVAVRDGHITRIDEYLDSAHIARLLES